MGRITETIATFIGALVFFFILGFLLSIVIPLLLGALPANVEPIIGPPVRFLEKILPGGINTFGIIKNVIYAIAGTVVKQMWYSE